MGSALLAGLLGAGRVQPEQVHVVDPDPAARRRLAEDFPGISVGADPRRSNDTIVAVKPGLVETALGAAAALGTGRVLSLAAGVSLDRLEAATGDGVAVVRAMPNTPALVGVGAAAICGGASAGRADMDWANDLLSSVGTVVEVPEGLIDAVTGLSGSGPAYVFVFIEALIDAGVAEGLGRDVATELAIQTVKGAAVLMAETGQSPADARAAVTSPGGTTAAGVRALEQHAFRATVMDAVSAAAARSRELSK